MTKLPRRKSNQQQPPTVAIALFVLVLIVVSFSALLAVVIPGAGQMLLAGLLLTGFFAGQYFIWGRWLHRYVVEQERRKGHSVELNDE
ncbi:MAG: hypothetical protein ACK526_19110 [Planctomyces sp.]